MEYCEDIYDVVVVRCGGDSNFQVRQLCHGLWQLVTLYCVDMRKVFTPCPCPPSTSCCDFFGTEQAYSQLALLYIYMKKHTCPNFLCL